MYVIYRSQININVQAVSCSMVMMEELMLSIPRGLSCSSSSQDSCIDEAEAPLEQITVAVQCRYCDEYCCWYVVI